MFNIYYKKTELDDGIINIKLATGENSINYESDEKYKEHWRDDEIQKAEPQNEFHLKIYYNENNIPSLQHFNTGVTETDIIAMLEVAKQQYINEIIKK